MLKEKSEEYSMFPKLCESWKSKGPDVYFDGSGVPPHLPAEGMLSDLARTVWATARDLADGRKLSGYIDEEGIHYCISDDEPICGDLSQEFVFVAQPMLPGGAIPSAWQVFRFLQEPVKRVLFVGPEKSLLLEKTGRTMRVCAVLARLWSEERFAGLKTEMAGSKESRERGFSVLMKYYEQKELGSSSEMWEFWKTFANSLMELSLGLRVQSIM
jgi:hypothetical protein